MLNIPIKSNEANSIAEWIENNRPWLLTYERYNIQAEIQLPPEDSSLLDIFENSFAQFANHHAYITPNTTLTYQELDKASLQVAIYLQQLGLAQGSKIGIMLPNLLHYPIISVGILRAGMILVNISPQSTSNELAYQLNDADIKVLFTLENIIHIFQNTPQHHVETVIICTLNDGIDENVIDIFKFFRKSIKVKQQIAYFAQILQKTDTTRYQRPNLTLNDMAILQYTGGTTDVSKGAMLSHQNIIANILQVNALINSAYDEDYQFDKILSALPLHQIFAFTICCMLLIYRGYTGLLIKNPRHLDSIIMMIEKYQPNFLLGVNTLFNGLLHHQKFRYLDFSHLKATIGGGMAILPSIAKDWHMITGLPIIEGYGLAETSPVVTFNPLTIAEFTNKIGIPAPSTDVKIIDDNDKEMPIGERGEIVIKGPQVMLGYYHRPLENQQVFTAQGYLRTGDIGIMDERGFIKIVDRKKDMMVVSGFNVYPNEIEAVMMTHPAVLDCGAVGVPSPTRGEEPRIFIVKKHDNINKHQLLAFGKQQLVSHKRPRSVVFVDTLPKSPAGKILRKELRKMAGLE